MKEQVLSAEQMLELIDMGIDVSKASMCWRRSLNYVTDEWCIDGLIINNNFSHSLEYIPTFTLQDILNHFDTYSIKNFSNDITLEVCYKGNWVQGINGDNLLDIAFQMLKWCKENKYI